jgi:hypothetical protein
MSAAVWWPVRITALIGTIVYLLFHMEWSEDRLAPSAVPGAQPPDVALQDVIATKPMTPPVPFQTAAASPIIVSMAPSDRIAEQPMAPAPRAQPLHEVAPGASPAPAASEPALVPSPDSMETSEARREGNAAEGDGDGVFLPPPIAPALAVVNMPESPVSNGADAHPALLPSEELVAGQVSGANADGSSPNAGQIVYLPVANVAPAAGPAPADAILNAVETPKARPSGEPYSSGSGDTDKSGHVSVFLSLRATRPMTALTPAASIPTATEVSAALPANAASTNENSAAQRTAGKTQGKSVQSGADPQNDTDQSSSASDSNSSSTSGSESGSDQSSSGSSNTSKSDRGKSDSNSSTPGSDSKSGSRSNSDNSSDDQGSEGQQSADQSGSEQNGSSDASNNDKNGKAKGGNSGKGKNGKGDSGKGKKGGGKSG